ncbi:BatD family protein [Mucilaginibacter arboris]|uniref:Protein BatD n=1 Tax=Mucilaginibacter arboris TaxID=2682090 RepID=A0A7K1SZ89_9SPHI|nr:BatD family protein [Mucilaginibacter arboris]MVN22636.1 protein BatD [Mucilaginibacter arboris]
MKKRLGILSILLLFSTLLFAQKFTASVSKSNVGVGEQFEVDFSMNAGGTHFTPPNFNNFQVISGPNMSSDMTSVNGNTTLNITYSYILVPTKEGTFTIDAAAIVINGHTLVSSPLKVTVKGQAPPVQKQAQQAAAAPVDNSKADTRDISKQIFIRAVVDKTHAYVGEQIKVDYKIYTRVDILGGQPDKAPELNGFWNQDVVNKNGNSWKSEVYKGLRYNVTTIKQSILFPQHAGDLSIDPLTVNFGVRLPLPAINVLGTMYNNFKDVPYKAKSQPIIIHVIPLPTTGKPVDFTGAVGSFSLYTDADKKELKANETLNYTVEISGTGNLNLIDAPKINLPADLEKYDPKTTDRITVDSNGVSGSRKFSYLLIPRHQGDFTLNPVNFTYFNPASKKYITLPGKAFRIKVNKGDAQANAPAFNSSDQQDIKLLGNDIRYIKTTAADLYKDGEGFYNSAMYYILLLLGPILFAAALFYRKWNRQYNSDLVKVKSRGAGKMAAKHLANAQKELTAGNRSAFYDAIAKGLYGYLSDKLNIPVANLNKENITAQLQSHSINSITINHLVDTMDLCEMARFAPVTGISEQQVFDKAKNTINEIEDKI